MSLFEIDRISSLMIGMSIMLMLGFMRVGQVEANVDSVVIYHARTNLLEFGEWLASDLSVIGAGVDDGQPVFGPIETDADGNTTSFAYYRKLRKADAAPTLVTYTLESVVSPDQSGPTLYRVSRRENGAEVGASMPALTSFRLQLLDSDGAPTTDTDEAAMLAASASMATRLGATSGRDAYIPETYWGVTVGIDRD